jgi:hypothetical protein
MRTSQLCPPSRTYLPGSYLSSNGMLQRTWQDSCSPHFVSNTVTSWAVIHEMDGVSQRLRYQGSVSLPVPSPNPDHSIPLGDLWVDCIAQDIFAPKSWP